MNRRSAGFRLTAWYALVLASTLAVVGCGAWWAIRDSIHDTADKELRSRLNAMRDFLHRQASDPDSGPLEEELAEQAALAPAGSSYRLAGMDGRWIYQSPGTKGWSADAPDAKRQDRNGSIRVIAADGKAVRVLTAPMEVGVIEIGIPLDEFYEMLDDFTWTALLASPFVILIAGAGGFLMSRRVLEPVDRIRRGAQEIEARNLNERLPVAGTGDELDRLSVTLNSMFSRLEASFQRMTQFTADASHELRTPLAVIRTAAEVARSKPRGEQEYVRALDRILAESERTTRLIEDLMLLARADAGGDGVPAEQVDLAESVAEAVAEARVLAEAARVRLPTPTLDRCVVDADGAALRRLWLILLDNAVKYTPAGGEVTVSLRVDGPVAVVEVQDTGIGIPQEDLPHIFERFYRAAKDRSRQSGGAGLGLSIAQCICHRHRARITVESEVGRGSLFRVRLARNNVLSPFIQDQQPQSNTGD